MLFDVILMLFDVILVLFYVFVSTDPSCPSAQKYAPNEYTPELKTQPHDHGNDIMFMLCDVILCYFHAIWCYSHVIWCYVMLLSRAGDSEPKGRDAGFSQ